MHIYPAIDLRDGRCVRLVQGDYNRETIFSENPVVVAKRWVSEQADRLHLVDLDGAKAGRPINGAIVRDIVKTSGVPCQLGGGIRTDADLEEVFGWGVQWAVLGTKALQDPAWICRIAEKYPRRIVLGLDARDGYVATHGWLDTSTLLATELAKLVDHAPLFAIVYTDIARDGMLTGPNLVALEQIQSVSQHAIIASGGVSTRNQVQELHERQLFGCIIGRALYEGQLTLPDALEVVRNQKKHCYR